MATTTARRVLLKHAEKPRPRRTVPQPPPEDFEGPDVNDLFIRLMDQKKEEEEYLTRSLLLPRRRRSKSVGRDSARSVLSERTSASFMRMDEDHTYTPSKKSEASKQLCLPLSQVPANLLYPKAYGFIAMKTDTSITVKKCDAENEVTFTITGAPRQCREAVRCISKRLEYDPSCQEPENKTKNGPGIALSVISKPSASISAASTPIKSSSSSTPLFTATKQDEELLRHPIRKSILGPVSPTVPTFKEPLTFSSDEKASRGQRSSGFHGTFVELPSVGTDLSELASVQPSGRRNSSSSIHDGILSDSRVNLDLSTAQSSCAPDTSSRSRVREKHGVGDHSSDEKQDVQQTVLELKGIGSICLASEKVDLLREAIAALCKHFGDLADVKRLNQDNSQDSGVKVIPQSQGLTPSARDRTGSTSFSSIHNQRLNRSNSFSSHHSSSDLQPLMRRRSNSFSASSRSTDINCDSHQKSDLNHNSGSNLSLNSSGDPLLVCTWDTGIEEGHSSDTRPAVLLIREPVGPDMSRSEISRATASMPGGMYSAKFRRRMFRNRQKDHAAKEDPVMNSEADCVGTVQS